MVAIRGLFSLITFDDDGEIAEILKFGTERFDGETAQGVGVELAPGIWHTVVALTEGAVMLEVKAGPFDPAAAKEFAPWAPEENTDDAVLYLKALRQAIQDRCTLAEA